MDRLRIHFLNMITFVCLICGSFAKDRRPNILVLISDDQNMNTIGAYGSNFATPNIDRLAKEGVIHTRA